jgi:hypothetical protein
LEIADSCAENVAIDLCMLVSLLTKPGRRLVKKTDFEFSDLPALWMGAKMQMEISEAQGKPCQLHLHAHRKESVVNMKKSVP